MKDSIYEFNPEDAFRFAASVQISVSKKGNELEFISCPYCNGGKTHDKKTFAINLKTGAFNCKRTSCGIKGNMLTLAKDFRFELSGDYSRYVDRYDFENRYRRWKDAKRKIEVRDGAIEYLKSRGISEKTCREYEITTKTDQPNIIVFPFRDENGEMRFAKYRNKDFVKGETKGSKEWCEANCMPILFGMSQCDFNEPLVITEGQIDSLSVAESGIKNAVSVPTGANGFTWLPYCWDWLHNFSKLIVFGDFEHGSMTLLDTLTKRLTFMDIYAVREEDYEGCKDANEILQKHGPDAVRNAVDNATQILLPAVIEWNDIHAIEPEEINKFQTGIYPIDKLLRGGIPFGGITLVSGKAGEGKSTFANQLIINAIDKGYKCFIYSGELPEYMIKSWMRRQIAGPDYVKTVGKDIQYGFEMHEIPQHIQSRIDEWMTGKAYFFKNNSVWEDEQTNLVDLIEQSILRYGIKVVLVDNLMTGIDLSAPEGSSLYERQSSFVRELARIGVKYDVSILLVAHRRKNTGFSGNDNDEIAGSSNIVNMAMLNLVYERGRKKTDDGNEVIRPDQRYIKLTKNRIFGDLNESGIVLDFEPVSKRIFYDCPNRVHTNLHQRLGWQDDNMVMNDFVPVDDEMNIPFFED